MRTQCSTLHSFINMMSYPDDSEKLLDNLEMVKYVQTAIIDETSLLGLGLTSVFLHCLVEACPLLKSIIFVGDHNQLPSVDYGNIIKDLMMIIPKTELKLCHRVSAESRLIFQNSVSILKKTPPFVTGSCFEIQSAANNEHSLRNDITL